MITAHINREKFLAVVAELTDEALESIALRHQDLFGACFDFLESVAMPSTIEAAQARAKKMAAAKREAPAVDKDALAVAVFSYVEQHPNQRGEDIASATKAPNEGGYPEHCKLVRRILGKFVDAGRMYVDGVKRGARFKVAPKTNGAAEVQA
jgi:hypothetical protein